MTDRKFTPPTEFPAEYVETKGGKVVILGRGPNEQYPLIGYDHHGDPTSWNNDGQFDFDEPCGRDLHDIPKRITTWHNVYVGDISVANSSREDADDPPKQTRLCVYRIERDEDGGNFEIFMEEV